MSGSQITLTVSLVMIALFTVAIISFALGFANDNNATISIADDTELNSLDGITRTNLSSFKDDSESTYASIVSTTIEPGSDVVRSSGSFTITWSNVFGVTTNMIRVGYQKIFGSGSSFGIFLTAFLSVITFMIALFLIKTWRGNP